MIKPTCLMTPEEMDASFEELLRVRLDKWDVSRQINYLIKRADVKLEELKALTGLSYIQIEMLRFPLDFSDDTRDLPMNHILALLIALRTPFVFLKSFLEIMAIV